MAPKAVESLASLGCLDRKCFLLSPAAGVFSVFFFFFPKLFGGVFERECF